MIRIRGLLLAVLPVLAGWSPASLAQAAWTASVSGPRVAGPGRDYASPSLVAPSLAGVTRITQVRWRYALPADRSLQTWLCLGRHCQRVHGRHGSVPALPGTLPGTTVRMRFRLPEGVRRPVQVGVVQWIVEYR